MLESSSIRQRAAQRNAMLRFACESLRVRLTYVAEEVLGYNFLLANHYVCLAVRRKNRIMWMNFNCTKSIVKRIICYFFCYFHFHLVVVFAFNFAPFLCFAIKYSLLYELVKGKGHHLLRYFVIGFWADFIDFVRFPSISDLCVYYLFMEQN